MRKTFWPAARSSASRLRSVSRSAKAAVVTISPYTNGLASAITQVYVMITAIDVMAGPAGRPRSAGRPPRLHVQLPHGPHLDAAFARRRDCRGDLERLVQIPGVDQVEPGELFLRFRERAVGHRNLAETHAHGRGGRHRL